MTLKDTQQKSLKQAESILDEANMTLEEKLEAINRALAQNVAEFKRANPAAAPIDPQDALNCEGCQ